MDSRGYLLPTVFSQDKDNLACAIVFFPDYPEARRALQGSIEYLGTWLAWEKDGTNKASQFAQLWQHANLLTLECLEMATCLDDLINALNIVNNLTVYSGNCFCDAVTITNIDYDITIVTYNDGTPPTTYAGTPVADWADWKQHVCGNANNYIALLCEQNETLISAVELGSIVIGVIAAILGVLSSGGILLPVAWGIAAGVVTAVSQLGTAAVFGDVCSDLQAAEDEIREAIVCSGDLSSVIQAAINPTAWNAFYQFVNWNQAAAAIRAGDIEGTNLDPSAVSTDCDGYDCVDYEFIYEWPVDIQGWPSSSSFQWDSGFIRMKCHTDSGGGSWNQHATRTGNQIRDYFALANRPNVRYIGFRFMFDLGSGSEIDQKFRINIIGTNGSYTTPEYHSGAYALGVWHSVELDMGSQIDFRATATAVTIDLFRATEAPDGQSIRLDNFYGRN